MGNSQSQGSSAGSSQGSCQSGGRNTNAPKNDGHTDQTSTPTVTPTVNFSQSWRLETQFSSITVTLNTTEKLSKSEYLQFIFQSWWDGSYLVIKVLKKLYSCLTVLWYFLRKWFSSFAQSRYILPFYQTWVWPLPVIENHYITHYCLVNIINATLIKILSLKLLMVLLMLTFEVSVEESVGDRPVATDFWQPGNSLELFCRNMEYAC